MIKVLFVCHGNICRSPMAEYLFKDMVRKAGLQDKFLIASAATSTEEIGSDINPPARRMLEQNGIPCGRHCTEMISAKALHYHNRNTEALLHSCPEERPAAVQLFGSDPDNKVRALLSYTEHPRDISDPWYTHDYRKAFDDIAEGCTAFLDYLRRTVKL